MLMRRITQSISYCCLERVGASDGVADGCGVGSIDGIELGLEVGVADGGAVGEEDGTPVGRKVIVG